MTTRRAARRSFGRRTLRRNSLWIDTLLNSSILNGVQLSVELTGLLDVQEKDGLTLVRSLLHLFLMSNTTDTPTAAIQVVDMGIAVVSAEAGALNEFPDPDTATDRPTLDWIYRDRVAVQEHGTILQGLSAVEVHRDIRTKRKIGTGDHFIVFDSNVTLGTLFNIQLMGIVRSLYLTR